MDYATPNPNALKDEEDTSTVTTSSKATELRNAATEKARVAAQSMQNKATHLKNTASEKYEQGKAKAKDVHATSEDYVREHPTRCVLGAFGVGLLIGLLARRR